MFIDEVAAVPSVVHKNTNLMHELEKIPAIKDNLMIKDSEKLSEDEAFKKVYAHFFAGIIEKSLSAGLSEESQGLGEDYANQLYSKEIAEKLVSSIDLRNLMAVRSFK